MRLLTAAFAAALANLLFIVGGGGLLIMGIGAVPSGLFTAPAHPRPLRGLLLDPRRRRRPLAAALDPDSGGTPEAQAMAGADEGDVPVPDLSMGTGTGEPGAACP